MFSLPTIMRCIRSLSSWFSIDARCALGPPTLFLKKGQKLFVFLPFIIWSFGYNFIFMILTWNHGIQFQPQTIYFTIPGNEASHHLLIVTCILQNFDNFKNRKIPDSNFQHRKRIESGPAQKDNTWNCRRPSLLGRYLGLVLWQVVLLL